MNVTIENILLIGSVLLMISIIAGKTSYKVGVPVIMLFVIIGMLAGSEGILKINFDNPRIARFIGFVALNFILFSGGFETRIDVIRPVIRQGITLSTLGVFITAVAVGVFVWVVSDFTILEGLLLGSIVSSTDAAAVFSILKTKNLYLKRNIKATLELESGSNDPMAYFLTIAFTGLIMEEGKSPLSIVPMFFQQMIIGTVTGFILGRLSRELINRIKLDFEGLYPVLVIALMFFIWSFTNFIGGNGFLAIYLSAIYLGNQHIMHKKMIMQVFDGLAWLMQIILFLTMGLLVFPSNIVPVIGIGLLISAFLILVARPVSVFSSLIPFGMGKKEMTFISWVGLRGAVPIVFATYPLLAGVDKSPMIFNIVFFISLSSVLIQGTTLPFMAKLLKVIDKEKQKIANGSGEESPDNLKSLIEEVELKSSCPVVGNKLYQIDFPQTATVAIIKRGGKYIIPEGSTVLMAGDKLVILAENEESINMVRECILFKKKKAGT